MYTVYRVAVIALLVLVIGCGERVLDGSQEIDAVMQRAEDGWNSGDLSTYMDCYHRSDDLRFAGDDGIRFGWHQGVEN